MTGLSILSTEVLGKRLEMLHEAVKEPGCVGVLSIEGPKTDPASAHELPAAAQAFGVTLVPISIRNLGELSSGFDELTRRQCRAVLVMSDPLFVAASRQLV